MQSEKPVKPLNQVLGKRMYVFPKEYATDFDPEHKIEGAGMLLSINATNKFIPCEVPVELTYEEWSLLKNIGRISRVVGVVVKKEDETKE